jgi:hypothetical protein
VGEEGRTPAEEGAMTKYAYRSWRTEFSGFDHDKEHQRSLDKRKNRVIEAKRKAEKKKAR